MLTNIESILSSNFTKTYSWTLFLLSFLCIGINILHVIIFCANDDTIALELTLTKTKIFCLTDGIWSGTLGLTVGFVCNIIWFEKTDADLEKSGTRFADDDDKRRERIFRFEAVLFLLSCLVTVLTFVGVYLSGYTIMYETLYFKRLTFATVFCHWIFCIQTLMILVLSLTTFSLAIFAFNVLLPLFYVELARSAWTKLTGKPSSEWRGNMSFSGSSVQFGTIQTLSDTSIASLKRRLCELREKENGVRSCSTRDSECSSLTSGSSGRHSRQDLIIL